MQEQDEEELGDDLEPEAESTFSKAFIWGLGIGLGFLLAQTLFLIAVGFVYWWVIRVTGGS